VSGDLQDTITRLRYLLEDMQNMLDAIDSVQPPEQRSVRVHIERWTQAVGSIVVQADAHLGNKPTLKAHMAAAILERDVCADATDLGLRDLTQIAALIRPECTMTIKNADVLSALERAGIETACPGAVTFE
jgi:hypothetical protein